jgi:hypothetical protein
MKNMTRQEFVASLRRKSSGFSRGASIYRGVTRFILPHLLVSVRLPIHSPDSHRVCPFPCYYLSMCACALQSCRHHQHGRWQARIGRVAGNKDLYLGTFSEYTFCLHVLYCSLGCTLVAPWINNIMPLLTVRARAISFLNEIQGRVGMHRLGPLVVW